MLLRPALIALQFLTAIPIRLQRPPAGRELGLSLLWYPVVGLLIGVLLWVAAVLLASLAAPLAAALVLALWVAATGALHLDGLADTADAWVGGRGDRERTLAIMRDPHCGPMAVAAVVCLLLVKFGALAALRMAPGTHDFGDLHFACGHILPPLLARALVPLLFAHTPYAREQGLGAELALHQSRRGGRCVAALAALGALAVFGLGGLLGVAAALAVYLLLRRAFLRRLGGMTGDNAGAMIESSEAVSLAVLAAAG